MSSALPLSPAYPITSPALTRDPLVRPWLRVLYSALPSSVPGVRVQLDVEVVFAIVSRRRMM